LPRVDAQHTLLKRPVPGITCDVQYSKTFEVFTPAQLEDSRPDKVSHLGRRHWCESLVWLDAFVNAAMILSGMGPLATNAGKLFAGLYALYGGLAVVMIAGIIFAPVVHRFLHQFHLEKNVEDGEK
jgi:hypothetical protein